jgi:hypothetical protein
MARPEVTGRKARLGAEAEGKPPSICEPPAQAPIAAYSIHEFCFAHRISVDHYFALRRAGIGPDIFKAGTRTLISVEAAARWRAAREEAAKESNKAKQETAEIAS